MTNSNINTAEAFVGKARKNEGKKPIKSQYDYISYFFFFQIMPLPR
jgi:hypothetical protein